MLHALYVLHLLWQVLDWELSKDDYQALSMLPFQQRMVNGAMWLNPKGPYR